MRTVTWFGTRIISDSLPASVDAGFSLNVANPLAAELFIREYGLERVTASCDRNVAQLRP